MRIQNIISITILLSFLLSFTSQNKLLSQIKIEADKFSVKFPSNYLSYVSNIQYSSKLISDSIDLKEISFMKTKYKLPKEVFEKLRIISFAKDASIQTFKQTIPKRGSATVNEFVGAAQKVGKNFNFAYYQIESHGSIVPKYDSIPYQKCKKKLFRKKKCSTYYQQVPRGLTSSELTIVQETLRAFAYKSLQQKLLGVNNDSQFILSSGSEIYSLSMKKTVTLTTRGQLYIHDPFEIYKYPSTKVLRTVQRSRNLPVLPRPTKRTDVIRTVPVDLRASLESSRRSSIAISSRRITAISNAQVVNRIHGSVRKDISANFYIDQFPDEKGRVIGSVQLEADNPFSFIIKTNGNMVITNKKGSVVWESKSGNKGVSPYTLIVTEDSNLMLCDDNWKPIYDSKGLFINKKTFVLPQEYRMYSEDRKYYILVQNFGNLAMFKESIGSDTDQLLWDIYSDVVEVTSKENGPFALTMEANGNLVIVDKNNKAVWTNEVSGPTGEYKLVVTNSGHLSVINSSTNKAIWTTEEDILDKVEVVE